MKIIVTGAKGLLGWHCAARLHAANCAAKFKNQPEPYELVLLGHEDFDDDDILNQAINGCQIILHWAGVNRGEEQYVEAANPAIAQRLVDACKKANAAPYIVYANSIHAQLDNFYGRSKQKAHEILQNFAAPHYCNLILPHIFGECAKPYYNNVTATFIDKIWNGESADLDANGRVQLLHAGQAADLAIEAALQNNAVEIKPAGMDVSITQLWDKLNIFHNLYTQNIFPDLSDPFDLALFNSYRSGGFPKYYPMKLKVNEDQRGKLFESAKGGNASHTFLSTTHPGKTRGDHFHCNLVERFLVVSGDAVIRIRKVLDDQVHEFYVSGDQPVAIDQIPLHTHNIENIGQEPVITFFWSDHIFDPNNPDTYADKV